jgi:hypothetical protein
MTLQCNISDNIHIHNRFSSGGNAKGPAYGNPATGLLIVSRGVDTGMNYDTMLSSLLTTNLPHF